jgi:hypothetical protein
MDATTSKAESLRQAIIDSLADLSVAELETLMNVVNTIDAEREQWHKYGLNEDPMLRRYIERMSSLDLPEDYDPDNDPLVGFFEGSPDLAESSSEILKAEFGLRKLQDDSE